MTEKKHTNVFEYVGFDNICLKVHNAMDVYADGRAKKIIDSIKDFTVHYSLPKDVDALVCKIIELSPYPDEHRREIKPLIYKLVKDIQEYRNSRRPFCEIDVFVKTIDAAKGNEKKMLQAVKTYMESMRTMLKECDLTEDNIEPFTTKYNIFDEGKSEDDYKQSSTPRMSILIITMPSRKEKLKRLMAVLQPQLRTDGSVELIVKEEQPIIYGGPNIGDNRNAALDDATGDYICFIDDDDLVPDYYVTKILEAIKTNPDVVGIKGHYIVGKIAPQVFIHSLQYSEWLSKDGMYFRCPNHLNPVKREFALQVRFPSKNISEDTDYSLSLKKLLKTEVMIPDDIMYFYLKD